MRQIIGGTVSLLQQDIVVLPIPPPRPALIRPAQAKGEFGLSTFPDFVYGAFQNLAPMEPVMVVAKAVDSIFGCQLGLGRPRLRQPQKRCTVLCRYPAQRRAVQVIGNGDASRGTVLHNRETSRG